MSNQGWERDRPFRHSDFGIPSDRESRFMESPLSLLRMHWDLEPIGFPLTRPTDTLSPIGGEGQGEGVRFMESPLSLFRMHWDPEPTPSPSLEGRVPAGHFPSWEGSGVGWSAPGSRRARGETVLLSVAVASSVAHFRQ